MVITIMMVVAVVLHLLLNTAGTIIGGAGGGGGGGGFGEGTCGQDGLNANSPTDDVMQVPTGQPVYWYRWHWW